MNIIKIALTVVDIAVRIVRLVRDIKGGTG
jgi:hypothetical protein